MGEHDRLIQFPVELDEMVLEGADAWRKHGAGLCRPREDVTAHIRPAIEPVRIIERAAAEPEEIGEALERKIQCRGAAAAKIQRDSLPATVRAMVVALWRAARENEVLA